MDERDSSTPNKDCWHSKYGNSCEYTKAPFPIVWVGTGDEDIVLSQALFTIVPQLISKLGSYWLG